MYQQHPFFGLFLACALWPGASLCAPTLPPGTPDGTCWSDPLYDISIKLSASQFMSTKAGTVASVPFKTGNGYSMWCFGWGSATSASYFTSTVSAPPSNLNPGWLTLTDQIDFKVIPDLSSEKKSAPFTDIYIPYATVGPAGGGVISVTPASVGEEGNIEFKLRKDIIGGAIYIPGGIILSDLYRYAYKGKRSLTPIVRLRTSNTLIPVPTVCEINKGNAITVAFGNIDSRRLSTSADAADPSDTIQRTLSYSCNTGMTMNVNIRIMADAAGFASAIATSNPNIGVVMTYNDRTVSPGSTFPTQINNGAGSDNIRFSVVKKNGEKPTAGAFTGTAILLIESL